MGESALPTSAAEPPFKNPVHPVEPVKKYRRLDRTLQLQLFN